MLRDRFFGCVLLAAVLRTSTHAADISIGISGIRWQAPLSDADNLVEFSRSGDLAHFILLGKDHSVNHIIFALRISD